MKTTLSRLLIAVLAAAALAVAVSPSSDAAPSASSPTRFSLTIDGVEVGQFQRMGIAHAQAWLDWGNSFQARTLLDWAKTKERIDAVVVAYDAEGRTLARYALADAWPAKIEIGALQAGSNEATILSITLCHEGFEIR
jgi:hypothetical protein